MKSYSDGRVCRASSSRSSKPAVVTSAVRAPLRSSSALVATVVPCTSTVSRCVHPPSRHAPRSTSPCRMDREGSSGVDGILWTRSPSGPSITRSVKVPPVSTPTTIKVDPSFRTAASDSGPSPQSYHDWGWARTWVSLRTLSRVNLPVAFRDAATTPLQV